MLASITRVAVVVALTLAAPSGGRTLYGWGSNSFGEVGDGTNYERHEPVPAARNPNWKVADAGASFACGIDTGRRLYCWGSNSDLRSGDPSGVSHPIPTRITTFADWSSVSAGGGHGCAIRGGGLLYCWGFNF